jgi:hypothetical protein
LLDLTEQVWENNFFKIIALAYRESTTMASSSLIAAITGKTIARRTGNKAIAHAKIEPDSTWVLVF